MFSTVNFAGTESAAGTSISITNGSTVNFQDQSDPDTAPISISNDSFLNFSGTIPSTYSGVLTGNGIRASTNSGGPYTLNIDSNLIDFFQKTAIVANGAQLVASFTNNIINGLGVLSTPAGIGIQFSGGSATISGNSVSGIMFASHNSSAGIFVFNTNPNVTISDNMVIGNDEGIFVQNAGAGLTIQNNTVQNSGDVGIGVVDTNGPTSILLNNLMNNGGLAAPGNANTSIYHFSSINQPFDVTSNSIMPAAGTPGLFTQGNSANQAPNVDLLGNSYIDP